MFTVEQIKKKKDKYIFRARSKERVVYNHKYLG